MTLLPKVHCKTNSDVLTDVLLVGRRPLWALGLKAWPPHAAVASWALASAQI